MMKKTTSSKEPIRPAIRRIGPRAGREVGVFLFLIAAIVIALILLYIFNLLSTAAVLVGVLAMFVLIYTRSPPLVIQLNEYERAVILRYGKFHKVAGPGWVFLIPFIDEPYIVDLRVTTVDIAPQDVVTKDNIKLKIDAITFIKIVDPKAAVLNIENPKKAVTDYIRAHLRDVVGKMELEAVISQVNLINELLHRGLERISKDWGIESVKVEIQAVELPAEVMDAMHKRKRAEELKYAAQQDAQAQAIKIEAIKEAAGKLTDPALQYLYLQALQKVAEGRSSKIIFPLELTHLAERLGRGVSEKDIKRIEDDLRQKYDEFILEKTREGTPISTQEILADLKKRASRYKRKK